MKSIMPTVIAILGITILTLIASCLISFQMQVTGAQNFENNCVDKIQASYFDEDVVTSCKAKAQDKGYKLTVENHTLYEDRQDVLVKLDYTAYMPLFGISKDMSIESYAK